MSSWQEELKKYPVVVEVAIAWGEMDAFQHLNNTVYFRYFENARIRYFEKVNMIDHMKSTGIGPILASTECQFRYPLTYPDTVSVGTRVREVEEDRFVMEYVVYSHQHQKLAAKGSGVIVTFDYQKSSKAKVPEDLRQKIEALENQVK